VVPGLSFVFAILFGAVPWLTSRFGKRYLTLGLVLGIAFSAIGIVFSILQFPWTNLVVLLVALTGGTLLGRIISKTASLLTLLLVLSALDVVQFVLTSGSSGPSGTGGTSASPLLYGNLLILPPLGRLNIGIGDILIIVAIAEHWRNRGSSLTVAEAPGIVGFALADIFLALVPSPGGLPLIPFFTVGWLVSLAYHRASSSWVKGESITITTTSDDERLQTCFSGIEFCLL
jgi:hypothetical protein